MRRRILALFALLIGTTGQATAQDQPAGIRLGAPYNTNPPLAAVRPFAGATDAVARDSLRTIISRDLRFSSRYSVLDAIPQALAAGEVDYRQWNGLNVVYLVTGEATPNARGIDVSLTVHDVVYSRVVNTGRFQLPPAENPDFRMAVHALSDEVVRWTFNLPGSAATRVALSRQNGSGSYDLLVVDSDGYGLRRLAGTGTQLYSPAWSPDARRILYAHNGDRGWVLIERNVRDGSQRTISPGGDALMTPKYAPDGRTVALNLWQGNESLIATYDLQQQCCLKRISSVTTANEMNPEFSPDGSRIAFESNRVGNPHIFIMPAAGGQAQILTPTGSGGYYTSPSWSPTGTKIAFHGRWSLSQRGVHQILIGDASRPSATLEQITSRGNNEDPSWAPDGRHLVYTSVGAGDAGLYIIDVESKNRRLLAPGGNLRMADWSPTLLRASDLAIR